MLAGSAGLTSNSFPLCLRTLTWGPDPVGLYGTPSAFSGAELRTVPLALAELVTTIGASTVVPEMPLNVTSNWVVLKTPFAPATGWAETNVVGVELIGALLKTGSE